MFHTQCDAVFHTKCDAMFHTQCDAVFHTQCDALFHTQCDAVFHTVCDVCPGPDSTGVWRLVRLQCEARLLHPANLLIGLSATHRPSTIKQSVKVSLNCVIVNVTSLRGVGLSVTKKSNICQVPPLHRHLIPGRPEAEVKFAAGDA